jgi:Alkylmercury lyase
MSLDTQTKLAIYRHFAEAGQRPSLQVVAERVRADVSSVREAYVRLRAQRVLVLEPDGVSIRMAPPFSGVPPQHVVIVNETNYFANCAWDSFGIPATLHRPGQVRSRCEQSGEPLSLEIGLEGPQPCSWLFHCLVLAVKWWDDIVTTCFSSGRKNGFGSGAPRTVIPCGRSSRWTNYGRSRRPGIRHAYKTTRGVLSPMRCVPFSRNSA